MNARERGSEIKDNFCNVMPAVGLSIAPVQGQRCAGKHPGATEHCLRGRPVKPRRAGQQSTRIGALDQYFDHTGIFKLMHRRLVLLVIVDLLMAITYSF
jgi:hypothetical protein